MITTANVLPFAVIVYSTLVEDVDVLDAAARERQLDPQAGGLRLDGRLPPRRRTRPDEGLHTLVLHVQVDVPAARASSPPEARPRSRAPPGVPGG